MEQHAPGKIKSSVASLEPACQKQYYLAQLSPGNHFASNQGRQDTSKQKEFVAHLGPNPNGILHGIQRAILTECTWRCFSNADETAISALSLRVFPKGFVAENGCGGVDSLTVWPNLSG